MASLEQRIADVLADGDATSAAIAAVMAEAEATAAASDAAAAKVRADALDPAVVVDAAKVGAAVVAAELTRDRLNAALPKLREAHREACERAYAASWCSAFEAIEGELDALAAELAEVYPDCVRRLVGILDKVPGLNARIAHLNSHAPAAVHLQRHRRSLSIQLPAAAAIDGGADGPYQARSLRPRKLAGSHQGAQRRDRGRDRGRGG